MVSAVIGLGHSICFEFCFHSHRLGLQALISRESHHIPSSVLPPHSRNNIPISFCGSRSSAAASIVRVHDDNSPPFDGGLWSVALSPHSRLILCPIYSAFRPFDPSNFMYCEFRHGPIEFAIRPFHSIAEFVTAVLRPYSSPSSVIPFYRRFGRHGSPVVWLARSRFIAVRPLWLSRACQRFLCRHPAPA